MNYEIIYFCYHAGRYFVSYERRNESEKADAVDKIGIYFFILVWSSIAGIGVHFIQDNHYNSFARELVVVIASMIG